MNIIHDIAYYYSQKEGKNTVERNALYELLLIKLEIASGRWERKSTLGTYLSTVAVNTLTTYRTNTTTTKSKVENSIVDLIETESQGYEVNYDRVLDDETISDKLSGILLSPDIDSEEYYVICATFGIGREPMTQTEIFKESNLSSASQRTLLKNAFNKLKELSSIKEMYRSL